MNILTRTLTSMSLVAVCGASYAQDWQPISQREASFVRQIDDATRSGRLNEAQALRLRRDFGALVDLETRYRASSPGLTAEEQAELDRRARILRRILLVDLGEREKHR